MGNSNGFISQVGINGKYIRSIQLIGSGELSVGGIQASADGDHYIFGEFTSGLRVGTYEISSMGGSDLFILQWGKNGELKNLSAVGGSSDEYFSDGLLFEHNLLTVNLREHFHTVQSLRVQRVPKMDLLCSCPLLILPLLIGFSVLAEVKMRR